VAVHPGHMPKPPGATSADPYSKRISRGGPFDDQMKTARRSENDRLAELD
jgi:hypothetical protein